MSVLVGDGATAPEVGQAVRVRNRLAAVRAVEPYDHPKGLGRLHVVDVEYLDDWRYPEAEQLLWEVEATAKVLGTTSLPGVDANRPDSPDALRAFVNAHRWTRLNRLRESDDLTGEPILGVWNSAIQVHAYQLEPVLKALAMPRVSLLLADGVGLGKTIQAGLVLEELLLRRRIRRILVLCPAMLQRQWKYELRRKFSLDFEVIDSESTFQLRRRLGIDTNPWKAFPRIITSMDYLRMPDVLGQFLQASGAGPEADSDGDRIAAHAPWDLLIVDEAHHFAPQGGGRSSQRTRMLREIRFLFEHRLFASATPHNGKTVCFTGLLELLDPIRFQMATDMDAKDRANLSEVRIRRLKDDINRQSIRPPFADQLPPVELKLALSPQESALYAALREYRKRGQAALGNASASERWLGQFIFSLLTKRLLSCPFAFARTWWRHLEGQAEDDDQAGLFDMARVSAERAEEQAKSDDERSLLEEDAARYSGAYFRSRGQTTEDLQRRVNEALEALGYDRRTVEDPNKMADLARKSDSKTERLVRWVKDNLFLGGKLRDDERLIVFTEYKETLYYLEQRLLRMGFDKNTLRLLYGGMNADEFEAVKSEFEDPTAAVRLLLATDAASEGINMQESCRWVVHYDIPWSPSRLQQRNGRVSRHGQVRDVSVHYFRCDQEEDMDFLFYVAQKVEQVRQDLGSVERIFDAAIQRHFQGRRTSAEQIGLLVDEEIARSPDREELGKTAEQDLADLTRRARQMLESTDSRLGISPAALADILKAAIAVEGQGSLDEIEGRPGFYRLRPPPRWEGLARQTLTVDLGLQQDGAGLRLGPGRGGGLGPAGHAAQEASGLAAAGPPDHAAGDGGPVPPAARPDGPRPDLPLVGGGPAPHRLRRPAGLLLHGHGDQRAAGAAARRGGQPGLPHRGGPARPGRGRLRAVRAAGRVPADPVVRPSGRVGPGVPGPVAPASPGSGGLPEGPGVRPAGRAASQGRCHAQAGGRGRRGELPLPAEGVAGPEPGAGDREAGPQARPGAGGAGPAVALRGVPGGDEGAAPGHRGADGRAAAGRGADP